MHKEEDMDKKIAPKSTLFKKISSLGKSSEKPLCAVPTKKEKVNICNEAIAVRAYFISERRRQLGWDGDETTDWIDAEKQLLAEALEK